MPLPGGRRKQRCLYKQGTKLLRDTRDIYVFREVFPQLPEDMQGQVLVPEGLRTKNRDRIYLYRGAIDAISHFLLHSEKEEVYPYASSILQE